MTETSTQSEPWLQPAAEKVRPSRVREFLSDLFAGNRSEMQLAAGVAVVPFAFLIASVAPVHVSVALLASIICAMCLVCLWAARSRQGLPQFHRGALFSFGMVWLGLLLILLYGLIYGLIRSYSAAGSGDEFYSQPSSYEVITKNIV